MRAQGRAWGTAPVLQEPIPGGVELRQRLGVSASLCRGTDIPDITQGLPRAVPGFPGTHGR